MCWKSFPFIIIPWEMFLRRLALNYICQKSGTKTETSSSTTKKLIDPKESATKAVKSVQPSAKTKELEGLNQFEALVRRLPTAKPLMNVPGFNEYGKLNYMCGLHILVWTFFCALVSIVLGLVVLIVGVFPMKDPRESKRFFVIICITVEMLICLVPSTFCMVSFFVRQRILLLGYTLGQLFSGVGMIVVVIILGSVHSSQSKETSILLPSAALSIVVLIFQWFHGVVSYRYRNFTIGKLQAMARSSYVEEGSGADKKVP